MNAFHTSEPTKFCFQCLHPELNHRRQGPLCVHTGPCNSAGCLCQKFMEKPDLTLTKPSTTEKVLKPCPHIVSVLNVMEDTQVSILTGGQYSSFLCQTCGVEYHPNEGGSHE